MRAFRSPTELEELGEDPYAIDQHRSEKLNSLTSPLRGSCWGGLLLAQDGRDHKKNLRAPATARGVAQLLAATSVNLILTHSDFPRGKNL
jgi:hypothetical protein